jgi:hypothetical protein
LEFDLLLEPSLHENIQTCQLLGSAKCLNLLAHNEITGPQIFIMIWNWIFYLFGFFSSKSDDKLLPIRCRNYENIFVQHFIQTDLQYKKSTCPSDLSNFNCHVKILNEQSQTSISDMNFIKFIGKDPQHCLHCKAYCTPTRKLPRFNCHLLVQFEITPTGLHIGREPLENHFDITICEYLALSYFILSTYSKTWL